jgi:acyl-homoserine-lactone acylase
MYLADRVLPDLLAAVAGSDNADAQAAAAILETWDHTADAASVGGVLFEEFWNEAVADIGTGKIVADSSMGPYVSPHPAFRTPWSAVAPFTTPVGLDPVNNAQLVADLANAYTVVQTNFASAGGASVPWGGAHKATLDDRSGATQDLVFPFAANDPLSGADDSFGPMRVVDPVWVSALGEFISYGGDGYVQIIEFTPTGAVGGTLLTYGNASRPNSAHVADQLPLFDSKTLKPALRTLSDVQANAAKTESY